MPEGFKSGELARYLNGPRNRGKGGAKHCAPTARRIMGTIENGAVRASPAAFNTAADIKALAAALKKA